MSGPGAVYCDFHPSAPSRGPGLPTTAGFGLCLVRYRFWWKPRHAAYADFSLVQPQGQRLLHWSAAELQLPAAICSSLSS